MIDVHVLREDPDRVRAAQRHRGESVDVVDELLALDATRRQAIATYEKARAEQKSLGRQVSTAQGEQKQALLARTKELSQQVKAAEATQSDAEAAFRDLGRTVPNLASPEAPVGGEDDFVVLEEIGTPRDFAAEGFEPRDHLELGEALGAIDMERGAKVSGARFYFLTGVGAQLELALVAAAMAKATEWGFVPMMPPALVKPEAMDGTGFLGQAADDVYHLPKDDLYLVGTSEVALAAFHSGEILDAESLPRRYAAFSPCYRREAGSYGKDTRGIFRVHWFDKVEMFTYTTVEESYAEHERLLSYEKEWMSALGLPFRVVDVAAGDLGSSAVRKFDCEAWFPSQQRYRELTSTSNCGTFQARRLGIRYRDGNGKAQVAATLNGTLCAVTRTIACLLEVHQQPDGSVHVPAELRPWLGGREVLEPA